MKNVKLTLILLTFFSSFTLIAQTPQSFKYQAIARDNAGTTIKSQAVSIRISILKTEPSGEIVYTEDHEVMTNQFGLVNLEIGRGTVEKGVFAEIEWGVDKYFLRLMMDTQGGTAFQWIGTAQLLSVPYALFSDNGVQFDPNLACGPATEGKLRYNTDTKVFEFCDGTAWIELGSGNSPFNCGDPLVDSRDGRTYATVQIGTQCWMAENLNYGVYKESVQTAQNHSDVSNNGTVEKYALDNDENNLTLYGGIYDWNEMMNYTSTEGGQGICPDGWHIPTHDEYVELEDALGGPLAAGAALKMGGSSGFDLPLGGSRLAKGQFSGTTTTGLWTSTPSASHPTTRANNRNFIDNADNVQRNTDLMLTGKYCRCIKD